MQACHWKAHNKFLAKDITWSEKDNNMYLEPVVAAQQVLDLSPQTTHPRKGGQNVIPETRYLVTYPGCYGKVFYPSFMYLTV